MLEANHPDDHPGRKVKEGVLIPEQVTIFIQDTSLLKKLCIILFVIMTSLRSIIQMNFYYARKWEKCKLQNEELRK